MPDRYTLCADQPPGSVHSVVVLLKGNNCDEDWRNYPAVVIYGGFNAAGLASTPLGMARVACTHKKIFPKRVWIAGYPFYRCEGSEPPPETKFTTLIANRDPEPSGWKEMAILVHCPDGPCNAKAVALVLKGLTIRRARWDGD